MDKGFLMLSLNSLLQYYEMCINEIDEIIKLLNDNENKTKDFKHNPFSAKNIKNVKVNGNKTITVKYENNNQTVLFNYNENNRSFSFEQNKEQHVKLILRQLMCEKNLINRNKDDIEKELKNIDNSTITLKQLLHLKYNTIVHHKKDSSNYFLDICPIYAFLIQSDKKNKKKKIYICNQYHIKFENNNLNIFYTVYDKQNILLSRPELRKKILEYNRNDNIINTDNFMHIINNMQNIFTDFDITTPDNTKISYKLNEIDKPIEALIYR